MSIIKYILFYFLEESPLTNENRYQSALIKKIKMIFPDCVILKNDGSNKPMGFPDLTILFSNGRWAELECKREANAAREPNQDYYVEKLNRSGYSRFVYPENEEEVLSDLQRTFGSGRKARNTVGK